MTKCPKNRKSSDLRVSADGIQPEKPQYLSPSEFARLLGPFFQKKGARERRQCSERTVREWCKRGKIREAYRTPGGHWRIEKPLSWQTDAWLDDRRYNWPVKGKNGFQTWKDYDRQWEPERAEMHALWRLYDVSIGHDIPVPYTWEWPDVYANGMPEPRDERERIAREIQYEILRCGPKGEPRSQAILISEVYQWIQKFSPDDLHCPTVTDMARFGGMSRQRFYRLYPDPKGKIQKAYFIVYGHQPTPEVPDDGLDSVQKQNRKAKKSGFASLHRQ